MRPAHKKKGVEARPLQILLHVYIPIPTLNVHKCDWSDFGKYPGEYPPIIFEEVSK